MYTLSLILRMTKVSRRAIKPALLFVAYGLFYRGCVKKSTSARDQLVAEGSTVGCGAGIMVPRT